jgi:hypothetical protein
LYLPVNLPALSYISSLSEEMKNDVVLMEGIVGSIGFFTTVQLSPTSTVVQFLPSFVTAYAGLK